MRPSFTSKAKAHRWGTLAAAAASFAEQGAPLAGGLWSGGRRPSSENKMPQQAPGVCGFVARLRNFRLPRGALCPAAGGHDFYSDHLNGPVASCPRRFRPAGGPEMYGIVVAGFEFAVGRVCQHCPADRMMNLKIRTKSLQPVPDGRRTAGTNVRLAGGFFSAGLRCWHKPSQSKKKTSFARIFAGAVWVIGGNFEIGKPQVRVGKFFSSLCHSQVKHGFRQRASSIFPLVEHPLGADL